MTAGQLNRPAVPGESKMPGRQRIDRATMARLRRSSILAFATYGAGAAVTYLSQLLIARTLSAQSYGVYSYVLAWVTILGYLAALGFDVSLLRLVPAYRAQGMWDLVHGAIRYAERRSAVMGLLIILVGAVFIVLLDGNRDVELTRSFLIGFCIVPVLALLWIRASVVRSFGGVLTALAPDRLVRDGLLVIFVGVVLVTGYVRLSAPIMIAATLVSVLVGLGLVTWARHRLWNPGKDGRSASYAAHEWRQAALPLVAIAVAEAAINRTGVVALGWAGLTASAGVYAVVFNVTSVVVLPRIAVNTRFAPMVSELFVRADHGGLQDLIAKTAGWTLMGAASMVVPLYFLAGPILAWFGPAFASAVLPMRVLLISQLIAASAGSQIFLLTMTGQERSAAVVVVLAALVNLGLTVPLVHLYGLTGAAIANAVTLLLWNMVMALLIYRSIGAVPGFLAIFVGRRAGHARRLA